MKSELIGLMFVVSQKIFVWGSLAALRRVPKSDAFVVVAVTVITIFTDLAIAVITGVVISALVFAWQHAKPSTPWQSAAPRPASVCICAISVQTAWSF